MFLSVEKFTPLLRSILCAATLLAAALSSGCTDPVNAPRALSDYASNTLFTSFSGRSPKTLDPQVSYSSDETIYTYGVYEPLYGYEYLKRPYTLMPLTAEKVVKPVYLDADKKSCPERPTARTLRTPSIRFRSEKAFNLPRIRRLPRMKRANLFA